MEVVISIAIGVMASAGVWLVLRPRTFQVLIVDFHSILTRHFH